jgi:hypothetical protein
VRRVRHRPSSMDWEFSHDRPRRVSIVAVVTPNTRITTMDDSNMRSAGVTVVRTDRTGPPFPAARAPSPSNVPPGGRVYLKLKLTALHRRGYCPLPQRSGRHGNTQNAVRH